MTSPRLDSADRERALPLARWMVVLCWRFHHRPEESNKPFSECSTSLAVAKISEVNAQIDDVIGFNSNLVGDFGIVRMEYWIVEQRL